MNCVQVYVFGLVIACVGVWRAEAGGLLPTETPSQQTDQMAQSTLPPGGANCSDLSQVSLCMNAAQERIIPLLFFFALDNNLDNFLNRVCDEYPVHRQCIESSLLGCEGQERLEYDVIVSAFDFACTQDGLQAVKAAWPCLEDVTVGHDLRNCSQELRAFPPGTSPCVIADRYVGCVTSTFEARCSNASADAIRVLLTAAFEPFSTFLDCMTTTTVPPTTTSTSTPPPTTTTTTTTTTPEPTTTTTATTTAEPTTTATSNGTTTTTASPNVTDSSPPTPPTSPAILQCFDCTSGVPGGWNNEQCTAQGSIDQNLVGISPCTGPCFSRLEPYGEVFRGCSAGFTFYEGDDDDGCRKVKGAYWCFCRQNLCNIDNMDGVDIAQP